MRAPELSEGQSTVLFPLKLSFPSFKQRQLDGHCRAYEMALNPVLQGSKHRRVGELPEAGGEEAPGLMVPAVAMCRGVLCPSRTLFSLVNRGSNILEHTQ